MFSSACRRCRLLRQRGDARVRMRRRVRYSYLPHREHHLLMLGGSYMEELIERARHIEVQCVGDGTGRVIALGERECTLQRKQQKIVEMAPSPSLHPRMREKLQGMTFAPTFFLRQISRNPRLFFRIIAPRCSQPPATDAALRLMSAHPPLSSLCTVEFLVRDDDFWFIEANPRLQVEHTVTEAVYGLDLVALQVKLSRARIEP